MQNSYVYPGDYTPSFMELTQAKSIGVPVLFINRVVSEREREEIKIRARIKKWLPILEEELLAQWRKDPKQNSLFHQEGQLNKEKNDITIHIYNDSPVGVFREQKDLIYKVGNNLLKSDHFDDLYHISTIK
ncbi:hypothetical protein [Adhaeribacter aquaticus]|uniref:hypothetical protein n=1 Tax=Adhaeribacter aquaticus TaxID=299567 RepID=UPI00047D526B|nr:hypothetical protein [Adhaeribacter aquaticus]